MILSGAEIVVKTLIGHGVHQVFGYPGGSVLNLYDALYQHQDEIKHYITCHEQGASHAADGFARATGKPGVVIATSGPGATNLVTGLASAYLDSTPVIAITGNVPRALIGKDSFQEVDITGITMPITKHNYIVSEIEELEKLLCEAFYIACSGRPGPVLIDIPKDIQIAKTTFYGIRPWKLAPFPEINSEEINCAAECIKASKKPYIYAGGGVINAGAYKELAAFADQIDAPIGFSMMGLSALSASSPRVLGMTGMHGSFAASKASAEADLIIGIGVRFSDRATGNNKKYQENTQILHIDIDQAEMGKNISAYTGITGNIKEVLPLLSSAVAPSVHPEWQAEIETYKQTVYSGMKSKKGLAPKALISCVRAHAEDDTIIATDVGQHQMWVAQYYPFSTPRTFITSGGLGTMGFGMGAAIGASIAKNFKKTILFTGDGSFHMNLNELATAVMHQIPLIVIIMNNGVLGMVRQWQNLFFNRRFSNTTLNRQTDYVMLAKSFGAEGYRVTTLDTLNTALVNAFTSPKPVVIDCLIDPDERVLPMIPPNGSIEDIICE